MPSGRIARSAAAHGYFAADLPCFRLACPTSLKNRMLSYIVGAATIFIDRKARNSTVSAYPCVVTILDIDGAYFGTSFPHLFFQQYKNSRPQSKHTDYYIPKIFGFKLHASTPIPLPIPVVEPMLPPIEVTEENHIH